jgi:signal transduction histidine kinase
MALFRRPVRSRPIRLFLLSMFVLPLVSLVALWVFAAGITVRSAISNQNYNSTTRSINASITALSIGLPQERAQSYLWLITGRRSSSAPLIATRNLVDKGLPATKAALTAQLGQLSGEPKAALSALLADLGQLGGIRQSVDSGALSAAAAFGAYTGIIDVEFRYFYASIQDKSDALADVTVGAVDGDYALEMASREATLAGGAFAVGGQMSDPIRQLFITSAADRNLTLNQALDVLTPVLRAPYLSVGNSPEYQQFVAMENQILASSGGGPIPVSASAWQAASTAYLTALQGALTHDGNQLAAMSASLSDWLMTEAILAGGVGLVAVIGSVILLIWFGRKVTRDLTQLHGSVRDMAEIRLPRVVRRLRQGEDVDIAAESPPPGASAIREISQIAESFAAVQEEAVTAAVDQARLRKGVNQVFLNISMRNQSLLHRQLAMLDSMERGTSEPAVLADLFRLDHLTTRMRRHAEGLIILSGATPGRGWREPVPVVDVLRAAVAEVEDYVRVDVVSESRDLVAGGAVGDVIHLVAELVENATVFSPPNTRIEIRADRVGTGLVAEIEDRGLGLTAEERAGINQRLASAPEFDMASSEQLGLFVVGRLAARQGIKVSLRESVYGGTTAVLLMPFGVIVREEEAGPLAEQDGWLVHRALAAEWDVASGNGAGPFAGNGSALLPPPELGQQVTRALPPPAEETPVTAASASWTPEAMTPWPQAFQPPVSRQRSQPDGRASAGDGEPLVPPMPAPAPTASGSHLGMPIRVPQASLAPQLQGRTAAQPPAREAAARSPEAHRDLMILMQQGWQRGRVDDLDDPAGAPDNDQ